MSPPQFATSMNNQHFEPHSFKRPRDSQNNHFNVMIQSHILFKTRICSKFRFGACRNAQNCNFAHGLHELRQPPPNWQDGSLKTRECSAISIGTYWNWKTKLCLKWQHAGSCPFGEGCLLAHGEPELQIPGGGIEAAVAIANSTKTMVPTLPNSLSVFANDAPATFPASQLVEKEDEQAKKKRLLKLKFSKTNRIYGDWIDDLPLVLPNLPRAVET